MVNFRVMERGVAREKHRGIALEEPRAAAMPPRGLPAPERDEARDAFLSALRSNGRYKYSRYNGLPLRYAGGKSLAVGHVVENIPYPLPRIVSPFIGGGSVEIACAKELGVPVRAYDVFDVLANYWEVQLSAPQRLADRIRQWEPTQGRYRQVKQRLKEHWTRTRPIEDALELAAHYWFNHNLSYGPGFLGWMSNIYEDEVRYERLVAKVERFSCPLLSVARGGFEETIPAHVLLLPLVGVVGGMRSVVPTQGVRVVAVLHEQQDNREIQRVPAASARNQAKRMAGVAGHVNVEFLVRSFRPHPYSIAPVGRQRLRLLNERRYLRIRQHADHISRPAPPTSTPCLARRRRPSPPRRRSGRRGSGCRAARGRRPGRRRAERRWGC